MEVFWLGEVSVPYIEEHYFSSEPLHPTILFATHPPTITFGRNMPDARIDEIITSVTTRSPVPIEFCKVKRGGQATYHGPGHLMIYPRVLQASYGMGVNAFVTKVLTIIQNCLARFGVFSELDEACQGLWISSLNERRKLASVGFRLGRGYSSYGVDLYVEEVGEVFGFFSPCGIESCKFTSVSRELGESAVSSYTLAQELAGDFKLVFSS